MRKQIIRRPQPEVIATELHELHPLLTRIYAARQVKSTLELESTLERLLPYSSLLRIDAAAELLQRAIMQQQKILIVGDFDADGATSTAVAMRALKSFGAQHAQFLVPNRFAYGYGLTPELVQVAAADMPDLIVTVDNGIANHAGVDAAKALGIKVLITDHHLPAATLPAADAIVNPNQPHDLFPSKNLAGVGVIFYVMLAVRKKLQQSNWFALQNLSEPNMAHLLDLVALGTVADLVPLDHNNRILVRQGLRRLRTGRGAPGIVALLEMADRDFTRVVTSDLGFVVGARLNAAGRLDDMSLGIACLLSDDPIQARHIARQLDQLNRERRSIEQDMQAQAFQALDKLALRQEQLPRGLCLYDEAWHQGVIGILASRLKEKYNRPTIVFAPGQGNEVKGSARSIQGLHIRDTLALIDAQHPNLIMKFGGHAMAAGLTILRDDLARFQTLFDEIVAQQVTEAQLQHSVMTDGELQTHELTLEVARLLRQGGPWGQCFPEPVFDDVFTIVEQRIVGDKHLKLRLQKADKLIDGVAFFVDTNEWPNHRCEKVRAVYRLDVNEYKGRENVQVIIEYFEQI